jgi:ArsR family transcriptional regulator, arsenate/arsenite/antimonite-responsive transcriptional repressor
MRRESEGDEERREENSAANGAEQAWAFLDCVTSAGYRDDGAVPPSAQALDLLRRALVSGLIDVNATVRGHRLKDPISRPLFLQFYKERVEPLRYALARGKADLTPAIQFDIRGNMEKTDAVNALAALAQDNRLDVFRLLVQAGPKGMAAGAVAEALNIPPNTLTFHFDRLRGSGLVTVRREGRSMIYAAQFDTMNSLLAFLTENCCGGEPCTPAAECMPGRKRTKATA